MFQFQISDWLGILLALVGVLLTWTFYRLQKRDVVSAKEERIHHARSELTKILESYVVNYQHLTEGTISALRAACERAYRVDLNPYSNPVSLLQDVAWKLQQSSHLDIALKSQYLAQIDKTIARISESRSRPAPTIDECLLLVGSIRSAIMGNDSSLANSSIEILEQNLRSLSLQPGVREEAVLDSLRLAAGLLAGFILIFVGFLVTTYLGSSARVVLGALATLFVAILAAVFGSALIRATRLSYTVWVLTL